MTGDLIRVRVQLPFSSAEGFARYGHGWTNVWIREGTSDEDVLDEVFLQDTYRVRGLDLAPVRTVDRYDPGVTNTKHKVVIDLGACTGIFSALCLAFGASKVIAVEPEPANFELLRKNLARWGDKVTYVHGAVGAEDGFAKMEGATGTGHVTAGEGNVRVHTLEEIIGLAGGPVAILKMDVEGAEYAACSTVSADALKKVDRIHAEIHGPSTAAHLKADEIDGLYGALLTKLAYTHAVTVFGNPQDGGMIFAHAYTL